MFGSDVLDIVIGMVFIFLLLSLICSALNEFIETLVKNRARDLERGIRELIGDPKDTTNFVDEIYNHGLVNSLFKGKYSPTRKSNLPSYIPSANFAMAVIDLIENPPTAGIKLPDNVKTAYDIFKRQAAGDAAKLQASLEDWYDTGMDRVSGWYKRRAQWILVILGFAVAVAVNADAILIAQTLSNDATLRKGLVAMAQAKANQPPSSVPAVTQPATQPANGAGGTSLPATATSPSLGSNVDQIQQYVGQLNQIGVPFGWHPSAAAQREGLVKHAFRVAPHEVKRHGIGWLLTALAISMGAPFWFDLLDKIISVRTALKPQTEN